MRHPLPHLPLVLLLLLPWRTATAAENPDPSAILDAAAARCAALTSYACTMESFNRSGDRSATKKVRFTWAREDRVRMDVLEGGDKGSVLTRSASGQIRGRKGGLLKVLAVTLKGDDPRVFNLRGRAFYEADWRHVMEELLERRNAGWRVAAAPDDSVQGALCAVVDLTAPDEAAGVTHERVWIDRARHLPLRRQQFEGTLLVNEVSWRDLQLDPPVDDATFTL